MGVIDQGAVKPAVDAMELEPRRSNPSDRRSEEGKREQRCQPSDAFHGVRPIWRMPSLPNHSTASPNPLYSEKLGPRAMRRPRDLPIVFAADNGVGEKWERQGNEGNAE